AGALTGVFGPSRSEARPLWLGSSKSNIGHAQAAAGVLGVMKMVLSLQHEALPRTLHADEASPHIAWEGSGLALLQEARPWVREPGQVRRAGISSFGVSGTNAHVVLEEAPGQTHPAVQDAPTTVVLPLLVSGRDAAALREQAGRWAGWLSEHAETPWSDVVRTAALNRTHFDHRAALTVSDGPAAVEALTALAAERAHPAVAVGEAAARGSVVFVFPGHGSQWAAMGRTLLDESEAFAEAIAACDAALLPHTGWSVTAVLRGDAGEDVPPLDRVDVVQPALFAMGVGLAAAWRSLGLEPAAVVGHSQGEIAAAVVCGALTLADGAKVVALRSRELVSLAGRGGMAVVELAASEVAALLEEDGDGLSVAVVNTPGSTVVSGDAVAIGAFVERMQSDGV
ncbi:MAG: type I polyketide synthase, partial [Proteobacteria bacterium]|nr:type I polyketide synthase [Pseudomonadota bacterium]